MKQLRASRVEPLSSLFSAPIPLRKADENPFPGGLNRENRQAAFWSYSFNTEWIMRVFRLTVIHVCSVGSSTSAAANLLLLHLMFYDPQCGKRADRSLSNQYQPAKIQVWVNITCIHQLEKRKSHDSNANGARVKSLPLLNNITVGGGGNGRNSCISCDRNVSVMSCIRYPRTLHYLANS